MTVAPLPSPTLNRCTKCGYVLEVSGECRACRAAHAARSATWYAENRTEASARRATAARVKRRYYGTEVDLILQRLTIEQDGRCGCCGVDGAGQRLSIEWAFDECDDDGVPLLRAAVCRSCKIAIGRYVRPSRFALAPMVLERVERYVRSHGWQHGDEVLRRSGAQVRVRSDGALGAAEKAIAAKVASTEETIAWLRSMGIEPGATLA